MNIHLSQKDISCSIGRLGRRGTDGDLKKPSDFLHHPLHGAVVVEDTHREAEEECYRQNLLITTNTMSWPFNWLQSRYR